MDFSVLGYIAAICTTASFLPQALKTYKTKHTKDISLPMYLILIMGVSMWFAYGFFLKDAAIMGANFITFFLALPILVLKIKNG